MRMVEIRLMAREAEEPIDVSELVGGGALGWVVGKEAAATSWVVLRCSRMLVATVTQSELECMGLLYSRPGSMASEVLKSLHFLLLLLLLLPLLLV